MQIYTKEELKHKNGADLISIATNDLGMAFSDLLNKQTNAMPNTEELIDLIIDRQTNGGFIPDPQANVSSQPIQQGQNMEVTRQPNGDRNITFPAPAQPNSNSYFPTPVALPPQALPPMAQPAPAMPAPQVTPVAEEPKRRGRKPKETGTEVIGGPIPAAQNNNIPSHVAPIVNTPIPASEQTIKEVTTWISNPGHVIVNPAPNNSPQGLAGLVRALGNVMDTEITPELKDIKTRQIAIEKKLDTLIALLS